MQRHLEAEPTDVEGLFMGVEWIYNLHTLNAVARSRPEDVKLARMYAAAYAGIKAGNRRALRVGEESPDLFRRYMATFCREQAYCHLSPALVRNLLPGQKIAQWRN